MALTATALPPATVPAAQSDSIIISRPGQGASLARVHPVVLYNICDSYIRRPEGHDRVIGTLLGSITADGVVEIRNCYTVPHNESSEQVALDIEYHRTMLELHQKVNPREILIGWYASGDGVTSSDSLFQGFYGEKLSIIPSPVHLTVDTALIGDRMAVRAYVSSNLSIADNQLASYFFEIPVEQKLLEAERVGIDLLRNPTSDHLPTDLEGLAASVIRLYQLVDESLAYVNDVVEGKVAADPAIGRYLHETVSLVPQISADNFEKLFNDSLQDVLLVMYLSNLARMQLSLAEKLNVSSVPLL